VFTGRAANLRSASENNYAVIISNGGVTTMSGKPGNLEMSWNFEDDRE